MVPLVYQNPATYSMYNVDEQVQIKYLKRSFQGVFLIPFLQIIPNSVLIFLMTEQQDHGKFV
jgi:hypothetical protein